ncbi:uncharacterized protein LOC131023324 [Salvia miltiorrhiza]|uniref:uncharacterized protein LOC131023324 n=1 Tax=Salvia miltiorrhiza TaxID=226208 RepID=UPI0025AC1229|nr:uncharacterized protein LOC131023324 [Salvia miltiorrhiza]
MKALSYNIRGLGSKIKKREIREIIQKQEIDVVFLQETKMGQLSEPDLKSIWGTEAVEFANRQAEGRSGGILTLWNPAKFSCSSQWNGEGALFVNGIWLSGNFPCVLINVYASQMLKDREELWDRIGLVVKQNRDSCVCVAGDFNSVRTESDRVGRGTQFSSRDIQVFDNFIRGNELEEIRLQGRKFTWYQPQGLCKTKLDRFMVNDKWVSIWPNSKARGLPRSVLDHCPILMETKVVDWGPKPFRFINAWMNHPNFDKIVEDSWQKSGISGWSCFVFKEKLKRLKEDLKRWNS